MRKKNDFFSLESGCLVNGVYLLGDLLAPLNPLIFFGVIVHVRVEYISAIDSIFYCKLDCDEFILETIWLQFSLDRW